MTPDRKIGEETPRDVADPNPSGDGRTDTASGSVDELGPRRALCFAKYRKLRTIPYGLRVGWQFFKWHVAKSYVIIRLLITNGFIFFFFFFAKNLMPY